MVKHPTRSVNICNSHSPAAHPAGQRRRVSLVDWVSVTVMRRLGMTEAFAFDDDFADHGFTLVP